MESRSTEQMVSGARRRQKKLRRDILKEAEIGRCSEVKGADQKRPIKPQPGISRACVHRSTWPWGEASDEERDRARLEELYGEIVAYIGTPECSDAGDCRYVGVGSKPCGGPWHYLVYSAATVDEVHLMGLVAEHAAFEDYMNARYGYASTCDVPPVPTLECRDGICVDANE